MVAMEGIILFKQNKTGEWLKSKSDVEKKHILETCIKLGREQRQVCQQRKQEVLEHYQKQLQEREKAITMRKNKEKKKKNKLY